MIKLLDAALTPRPVPVYRSLDACLFYLDLPLRSEIAQDKQDGDLKTQNDARKFDRGKSVGCLAPRIISRKAAAAQQEDRKRRKLRRTSASGFRLAVSLQHNSPGARKSASLPSSVAKSSCVRGMKPGPGMEENEQWVSNSVRAEHRETSRQVVSKGLKRWLLSPCP